MSSIKVIPFFSCQVFRSVKLPHSFFLTHFISEYVTCIVFRAKAAEEHSLPIVNTNLKKNLRESQAKEKIKARL